MCVESYCLCVKVTQLCLILRPHRLYGILQARVLEWVAFPFSRESSQARDWTQVSAFQAGFFTSWATKEALSIHIPIGYSVKV